MRRCLQITACTSLVMFAGYAEQQLAAATLLDEVCGQRGCQFISGMGDNFYPCVSGAVFGILSP